MGTLEELTRPNIWRLKPYSSTRDEYDGTAASVFLGADKNPYNMPHSRYPDPTQRESKHELSRVKKISPEHIFLDSGSDGAIDPVFRAFCEPRVDNVVAMDPTYGTYQVRAEVGDVEYHKVLLDENFQFSTDKLLAAADKHAKLVFLCSPSNPTGSDLLCNEVEKIILGFSGLVILDKAYNDFSETPSFLSELDKYPNLIVLQTFSKARGRAAIHLDMAFVSQEVISILSRIRCPYNMNQLARRQALEMLHRHYEIGRWVKTLKEERENLEEEFAGLPYMVKIFPSGANSFLVRVTDAVRIYNYLVNEGIIVRNRNSVSLCGNCLGVTVGTKLENEKPLEALRRI